MNTAFEKLIELYGANSGKPADAAREVMDAVTKIMVTAKWADCQEDAAVAVAVLIRMQIALGKRALVDTTNLFRVSA